jgi:hypothetical protein
MNHSRLFSQRQTIYLHGTANIIVDECASRWHSSSHREAWCSPELDEPMKHFNLNSYRYMASPCGNHSDWFHVDSAPADWTDVTGMSDQAVARMMERRWWASQAN